VRVAKAPVSENEKYRVLVDQLPDPKGSKAGVVSVLVRHAIPLYFD
jgi:fimbrial chaperone protein